MKLLRTILLAGFLGLMSVASQQVSRADAMQPPRFTLTDLGSVDGQANPYTPPTGYTMLALYHNPDPYKNNWRSGWSFTRDGNTDNLLPDYIANDVANEKYHNLTGYSSSGVIFGDDFNTGSSFYYNTNTSEYGNFKSSGVLELGLSSVNSFGQALGATYKYFSDGTALYQATFYTSFLSEPVILKDLLVNSSSDWVLLNGAGLNDKGQIFGSMINMTTQQIDYYRLDPVPIPVPEPSSVAVISSGVLLYIARKKLREKR